MKEAKVRGNRAYFVVLVALLALAMACAPQAAPAPAAPAAQAPAPAAPALSPEEAAWAGVVAAAKKEAALTAYAYNWVGDTGTTIAAAFRQRYGIELQIVTGRGAEFLERLKVEKRVGKVMADVFEGSAVHTRNVMAEGLTAPLADLPILQDKVGWNIQPQRLDPTANMLIHLPWIQVPYINTKLVKPNDVPKTWTDLLLPKWKGKIVTTDPNVSNLSYYWLILARHGVVTMDFIQKMAEQDLAYVKGAPDVGFALARGEYAVTPNSSDSTIASFAREGAPIKAAEMDKGALVSGLVVARLKDGPSPNAAKVFLNWLLSDEGQKVEATVSGTYPMRRAVPDTRHPAIQVRLVEPTVLSVEDNLQIATDFRDKVMVKYLKSGR